MNTQPARKRKDEERKPSIVSAPIAALLSIVIPGLGQILSRFVQRGLVLFGGFFTVVGLWLWRIDNASRLGSKVTGWYEKAMKAFRLDPFLIFVAVLIVVLYIWIIIDAYQSVKKRNVNPLGALILLVCVLFLLGWQIGEINLYKMVTQADEALPALSRVLWPWQRAITFPKEVNVATGLVLSPCAESEFIQTPPDTNSPYLVTDPTCGDTTVDANTPGTTYHVEGYNLEPETETEIWWKDPVGNEFRQRSQGKNVVVVTDENGSFDLDIIMPYRLLPPSQGDEPKVWELQARQIFQVGAPEPSSELKLAIEKMVETIIIGMMATLFGIVFSVPVSFLAARNLMSASKVTLGIYYITRAILNLVRSIEPLIWAIIAVIVVGLGPFAGILALTLHSIAALGKLYSEAIESIDPGPIEAIQATGANWLQTVMFAVVPQIIPPFVSFTIYRWDINIRMSTIIGFVGGGGIGFLLAQWIRLLDYSAAGIAVWFIAITVALLDYVSAEIRARYV